MADADAQKWSGSRLTLRQDRQAEMTQTPDGSMVLAWTNVGSGNSLGHLTLTSGGHAPETFDAPALAIAPTLLVRDWHADNLRATNTSADAKTSIAIEAHGPGIGRIGTLPIGRTVTLAEGAARQGRATGGPLHLHLAVASRAIALFVVIGGPADADGNNATTIALNCTITPAPPGYSVVTAGRSYSLDLDGWRTDVYVSFFGPALLAATLGLSAGAEVSLIEP